MGCGLRLGNKKIQYPIAIEILKDWAQRNGEDCYIEGELLYPQQFND